jgi:hypothetical protein
MEGVLLHSLRFVRQRAPGFAAAAELMAEKTS